MPRGDQSMDCIVERLGKTFAQIYDGMSEWTHCMLGCDGIKDIHIVYYY